jgi:hypothetical protein
MVLLRSGGDGCREVLIEYNVIRNKDLSRGWCVDHVAFLIFGETDEDAAHTPLSLFTTRFLSCYPTTDNSGASKDAKLGDIGLMSKK